MPLSTKLSPPDTPPPPAQMDSRLASLALRCGVQLRVVPRARARYDRGAFVGYEDMPGHDASAGGAADGLERMRQKVARALAPTPNERIEPWLAELSVIAPSRQHDPLTDELRMTAYASRLSAYPEDVVHHALLGMVWRFWPSWAELFDTCEVEVSRRRAMATALDAALERTAAPPPTATGPKPSEGADEAAAQRARVQAVVRAFVGRNGGDVDAPEAR